MFQSCCLYWRFLITGLNFSSLSNIYRCWVLYTHARTHMDMKSIHFMYSLRIILITYNSQVHNFILNANRTRNNEELKKIVSSGLRVFISEADQLCAVGLWRASDFLWALCSTELEGGELRILKGGKEYGMELKRKTLSENYEKRLLPSSFLPVCLYPPFHLSFCPSPWDNSAATGRIFMKFNIWVFLENLPRKFKSH